MHRHGGRYVWRGVHGRGPHYAAAVHLREGRGSCLKFEPKDVRLISSYLYKRGLSSLRRNVSNNAKHVAGATPSKVQFLCPWVRGNKKSREEGSDLHNHQEYNC